MNMMNPLGNAGRLGRRSVAWLASVLTVLMVGTGGSAWGLDLTAITMDGRSLKVVDAELEPDWKIAGKVDGEPITLDARDLVQIKFGRPLTQPYPKQPHLILATGEVIRGEVRRTEEEQLFVRGPLGEVGVPLSAVRGVVLLNDAAPAAVEKVRSILMRPGRMSDEVILANGDVLQGLFVSMDAVEVKFDRDGEEMSLPIGTVSAIAFDPNLLDYSVPEEFCGQLRLDDGTVLFLEGMMNHETRLDLKTLFGAECNVNVGAAVDLSFRNGNVTYLSDVEPIATEAVPFLDEVLSPRMDRSVLGTPIQLGGKIYAKGIGVHSQTSLVYAVEGFDRFDAIVGMDDRAGDEAGARFRVFVDGKQAFDSGEMTALHPVKLVEVPLKGAKELRLTVEFASRGNVQDYADWGDAKLLRLKEE